MTNSSPINILFLASEADPLIKVGGLGDVAGSLPAALRKLGNLDQTIPAEIDIRLVIPFHPAIARDQRLIQKVAEYKVHTIRDQIPVDAYALDLDGLSVYLIDGPPIKQEAGVYSSDLSADGFKYVYFSQAALTLPKYVGWKPDILHANDWHTSPAVYSLALNRPLDRFYQRTASLLTVHNLPYLGAMTEAALDAFDLLPAQNTSLPVWASHMALPLGLLTADSIVAVSPGYAKEIMTPEFGAGLQSFLRAHSNKVTGILNGLDTQKWNPLTDTVIQARYSIENLQDRFANKVHLQEELELESNLQIPILAMVTRMDPQKGVDLAVDALRNMITSSPNSVPPFQIVFLGTGDPTIEQAVCHLEQDFPAHVRARISYNERLSRHIYAGADMLLMPSRYEPCGLSQMIAMRYGCVPIARATGGLIDTISDPAATPLSTGFLFKQATPGSLAEAIQRALAVYHQTPGNWHEMQLRGMQQDFSWDRSALEYLKQYKKLLDSQNGAKKYV
jgi:starch synthase